MNLWRWNKGIARGRRRPAVAAQGRAGLGRALRGPAPQGRRRSSHGMINDADTLRWLAQQNCITPHVWNARCDLRDKPDRIVFDLDPDRATTSTTIREARARDRRRSCASSGSTPFAKVSGSRGIHIVAPLKRTRTADEVRERAGRARRADRRRAPGHADDVLAQGQARRPDPRRRRAQHLRADDRRALRRARARGRAGGDAGELGRGRRRVAAPAAVQAARRSRRGSPDGRPVGGHGGAAPRPLPREALD